MRRRTWFSIQWKDLLFEAAIDSSRTDEKMDRRGSSAPLLDSPPSQPPDDLNP